MTNKQTITIAVIAVASLVLTLGTAVSAYAVWGHGKSYGPSFGGGSYYSHELNAGPCICSYKDGLKINGKTFDVSTPGITIPTQTLYVGAPSTITLKIFTNSGTYAIQGGAILINVRGNEPIASQSDTFIQFDKHGGVSVVDPHKFLADAKVKISYDKNYMYAMITFTPNLPMKTSNLILEAWDYRLSVGMNAVINAINISYVPQGYH
jgi:hypothetical protein